VRHFFCAEYPNTSGDVWRIWSGLAAESAIMREETIHIGMRDGYGNQIPFGISLPDLRQHVYVIGKTGSGKTTLLRNMIVQHIALGHGVGLIDPHGDLAEEILNHIPRPRTDHVVYFNPADLEFPVALNLLANVPKDERHLITSGIVGAFKSIWRDSWGPRMEFILYNAITALLDCQNTSLLGVNWMLTDENYRARVIRQIKDPFIKDFWEHEYASYDERFRREAIAPIQNKLGQFLLNPVIRNILGQVKCKVSFPFIMDNERLFIANLSKGKLGHDKANLLGSLLVTQFQQAAMHRANQPEHERRDFYLFIDEFQNFTTDSFAAILAEARKYRLCLTLSHQYVEQIPLAIQRAVFGNVGTLLSFRVGNSDAEVLQKEFANTFRAQQFVDLERFQVFAKILENGANLTPFNGVTSQPLTIPARKASWLLNKSRERFSTPRSIVESKHESASRKSELRTLSG
jgi:energy-coupling factor transporter ATP-binding protein EcfA2